MVSESDSVSSDDEVSVEVSDKATVSSAPEEFVSMESGDALSSLSAEEISEEEVVSLGTASQPDRIAVSVSERMRRKVRILLNGISAVVSM